MLSYLLEILDIYKTLIQTSDLFIWSPDFGSINDTAIEPQLGINMTESLREICNGYLGLND